MLDIATAFTATALVFFCLGAIQLAGAATRQFGAWLGWWAASNFLVGAGTLAIAFRGRIPDWISIDIANPAVFLGYLALVAGVRRFAGRQPDWLLLGTLFTVATGLIVAFPGSGNFAFRVVVASLCCATCDALVAWEGRRLSRQEHLTSARLLTGLFAFTCACFTVRAVLAASGAIAHDFMATSDNLVRWATVSTGILVTARGFVLLLLVAERNQNSLRLAAWSDPLTRTLNRIGLARAFATLLDEGRGSSAPLALLIVDLDHFKAVNDTHGHTVGDAILRLFAAVASSCLPESAVLARYGGDEFVVLVPRCDPRGAVRCGQDLREAFATALRSEPETAQLGVTLSIGVACGTGSTSRFEDLLGQADAALYRAKAAGRDRVSFAPLRVAA